MASRSKEVAKEILNIYSLLESVVNKQNFDFKKIAEKHKTLISQELNQGEN